MFSVKRTLALPALICVLSLDASAQTTPESRDKLFYPACRPFAERYTFDCYHNFVEMQQFLEDAAARYPGLARVSSLGKSFQGRDLWLITITDFESGDPESKPAIWVDGGIDSDEVIATEAALGLVHELLTSREDEVRELLRTRTFYIAPNVIPDGSEIQHTTPERARDATLRPWDDDNDGLLDEDGVEDLDGDGQALQMRKVDVTGNLVADERDERIMRERRPGDTGPFYRLYSEGTDDDGDGRYNEDRPGGIDPNRNYPGNWSLAQNGAGPFAGSEFELRAMLDFIASHPNIAASQHFHSSGGVVLHPPSVPEWQLPNADFELYAEVSRRGLEVTGYNLATSVYDWSWPRGSGNRKRGQIYRNSEGEVRGWPMGSDDYPAYGGSIDALYQVFGVLAFANEIYQLGEDEDNNGAISELERIRADDEELDGAAFKEWESFDHPQLGEVEIGGWRKFGQNNPIGDRLQEEVDRNVRFVLMQAEITPLLEIGNVEVESLAGSAYRITATIFNSSHQPTELAIRHTTNRAVPVRATIETGTNVELISSEAQVDVGTIGGHSEAEVEWIVIAPAGGTVTVKVWHPKAGRAEEEVELR